MTRFPDTHFDALLVVSFGGPEGSADVLPFLENVTRGRGVPRERLEEVARHYERFDGVSPLNEQNRTLIAALEPVLAARAIELPIYFGNRNWHPMLADAVREMIADGVERALALFTTAYSSYSSCRQYRENIYDAQTECGDSSPEILKIRPFYNHPGFVSANAARLAAALARLPSERRSAARVVFTAHSIPTAMAEGCRYVAQLEEAARLVAEEVGHSNFELAYQSRSGSPRTPWLEPDVCERLRQLAAAGTTDVVLSPIGFISDHIEVLFDLDVEAREVADELGLTLERAESVGTHPAFVDAVADLVEERVTPGRDRAGTGAHGPALDGCGPTCCLPGTGRESPWSAATSAS
ncbi:MAG: ferrochelatase [Gaiellaceae bacterium]